MSDKHANFVRLSERRLEAVEDAIRIYSNLSGPSYEWTMDEVRQGFRRISEATGTALERFTESRLWEKAARDEGIELHEQRKQAQEAPEQAAEPVPEPEAPLVPADGITPRQREMLRIWDEAANEQGMLVEMLAMQREVIAGLQSDIEKMRNGEYGEILRNIQPVGRGRVGGRQLRGGGGVVPADADATGSDHEADADV